MTSHLRDEGEIQRALLALAFGQLGSRGTSPEPQTETYLEDLIARSVARMSADGRTDDEGFVEAADHLAQVVVAVAEKLPIMADGTLGQAEASAFEEVLAGFCPGFWPFC